MRRVPRFHRKDETMRPAVSVTRTLALWLVVSTAASVAEAATATARDVQELPLPRERTLVVQNVNGPVVVVAWDRDTVRIEALRTVRGPNPQRAEEALAELQVEVVEERRRLLVRTRQVRSDGGVLSWMRGSSVQGQVSYALTVPRFAQVEVATVNGRVEVRGLEGSLRASSTNGAIALEATGGTVRATTTNGAIRASVAALDHQSGIDLSTVNGSITLSLPHTAQLDLDARTVNGSVSTDLPVSAEVQRSRTRLVGSIQGGGAPVRLRATNGSLRIVGGG
jgi:hypothetical protein